MLLNPKKNPLRREGLFSYTGRDSNPYLCNSAWSNMLVQCSTIELLGGVRDGAASPLISIKSIMEFH